MLFGEIVPGILAWMLVLWEVAYAESNTKACETFATVRKEGLLCELSPGYLAPRHRSDPAVVNNNIWNEDLSGDQCMTVRV
jgi:hypothetical protein